MSRLIDIRKMLLYNFHFQESNERKPCPRILVFLLGANRRQPMKSFVRSIFVPTLMVMFLTHTGVAQIGAKAGLNLASQRQGGFTQEGSQTGFLAGIFFPLPINELFTLQPEVLFVQKGGKKQRESEGGGGSQVTTKLNSLDFVLISKIHLGDLNTLQPHILFGPYVSYLLSGTYIYGDGDFEEDIEDYHKLELGYTLGLGTDLILGANRICVDARFSHALTDIHNTPSAIWNKGFSLTAGFSF